MKLLPVHLTLAAFAFAMPASAEPEDPKWSVSASGSWSEISSSDRDAVSFSLSLSRHFSAGSVGASIGTSNGSDALFDATEITDRSSIFGSVWAVFPVGAVDLDLSLSLGQDDFDGDLVIEDPPFDDLTGAEVTLVSEVDTISFAAAVSRILYAGDWDFVPNASLGWSQSNATTTITPLTDANALPAVNEEQSGITASAGLGIGYVASERLYVHSDLVALYAQNGASTGSRMTSRGGNLRSSARQDPDQAIWGEFTVGAAFHATDRVSLGLSGGTTAGRDTEEVFVSSSVSVSF